MLCCAGLPYRSTARSLASRLAAYLVIVVVASQALCAAAVVPVIPGLRSSRVVRIWNKLPRYCRLTWDKAASSMADSIGAGIL